MTTTSSPIKQDPYFFDREDLQAIAPDETIRQGLTYYKDNRVIEVDQYQDLLWGRVEGADSDIPYESDIRLAHDGKLTFQCTCDVGQDQVCLHIVAVLFAYADQFGETNKLLSATDKAIKERTKRGH